MVPPIVLRLLLTTSCLVSTTAALAQQNQHVPAASGAAIPILSGFDTLWTKGATWDTGSPTLVGEAILRRNLEISLDITSARTAGQEEQAYFADRRNQNYSVIDGLGPLADRYKAITGAFTTITEMVPEANTQVFNDDGNGAGSTSSALGKVVALVNALRGGNSSTNPAKSAYDYPRPYRQTLDGESLDVIVQPSLVPRKSNAPQTDGGFPSGHTNAAYLAGIAFAYAVPQQLSDEALSADSLGRDRIVAGMHSPLDVIGRRMHGLFYGIDNLMLNPVLRREAYDQAQAVFAAECGGSIALCYEDKSASQAYAELKIDKETYRYGMTYGLAGTRPADAEPVVPANAEVLIETRFGYLTDDQRREVLATTEAPSGGPLDNGLGYDRIDLVAASGGYGAFRETVEVTMNGADGGYSAADRWLNDIGGTGGLVKRGTGALTLAGANTYAGGTRVGGGTLVGTTGQAFGTGAIAVDGTLVVDADGDTTLANALSGAGTFVKDGTARLVYSGNGSGFVGETRIDDGSLSVMGALGGRMRLTDGATLSGTGTVGSITLGAGARLAPGNSIGTLDGDDLTTDAGSVFEVEVDPSGIESDRLDVTGTAQLNGGSVRHIGQTGTYRPASAYTFLTAKQGVSGTFANATSDYAFLTPSLGYAPTSVTLQLDRNDIGFADLARTADQKAVAGALDTLTFGDPLYDAVVSLRVGSPGSVFDKLSGEGHASLKAELAEQSFMLGGIVGKRLATAAAAEASADPTEKARRPGSAGWGVAYGSQGSLDGSEDNAALDSDTAGLLVGMDTVVSDTVRIGVLAGYGAYSIDVDALSFSADADTYHLGAYAGASFSGLSLEAGLINTWHEIETDRSVAFSTFADRLSADYDADALQLFGEAAYAFDLDVAVIEPFAGLTYVSIETDGFIEDGGAAALAADGGDFDTAYSTLGLRVGRKIESAGFAAMLSGSLAWRHAFDHREPSERLAFASSKAFSVSGTPVAEEMALVGAGIDVDLGRNMTLGASYDGQFSSDITRHGARVDFSVEF